MARKVNAAGIRLIKRYEGFRSRAYKLPGERYWTIGYGDSGPHVKSGQVISEVQATRRLQHRVNTEFAPAVERLIKTKINDNRFAALVSLAYNIGLGNFQSSTVLRETNQRHFVKAAAAFRMWVKDSRGKVLLGLLRRRISEARLYSKRP